MTGGMNLLDHLARLDDPEPSREAAGLDHSGLCARALVALVRGGAATTDELLGRLGEPRPDRSVLSRRMTTLVRRGLAVDTGMRRPSTRGVPVTVFAATPRKGGPVMLVFAALLVLAGFAAGFAARGWLMEPADPERDWVDALARQDRRR